MAKKIKARAAGKPIIKGRNGVQMLFYVQNRHAEFLREKVKNGSKSMSGLLAQALDAHFGLHKEA